MGMDARRRRSRRQRLLRTRRASRKQRLRHSLGAKDEGQTDFGQNLGLGFNFRKYQFKPFVEGRFHFFNDVQFFTFAAAVHL